MSWYIGGPSSDPYYEEPEADEAEPLELEDLADLKWDEAGVER
jgi:hypothetical protein